jgi:DUF1009 family protein
VTATVPAGPVAIVAGSGELPLLLADHLARAGREHRILAYRGFASRALRGRADAVIDLLDVKGAVTWLDRWRPAAVTLAGGVRRPNVAAVTNAFSYLRNREEVAQVAQRGDDNLLRGAISLLEEKGHLLVGVLDLAPELLAQAGPYGAVLPGGDDLESVALGMRLLHELSAYDIGQSAILSGQRVVAIEGPEGTDRMIARAARLERGLNLRRLPRAGVLVKGPKRGQDLRVDLPAIGPRTVVNAAKAGLRGIAVTSGLTLVLNRRDTVRLADKLGLFVVGLPRDGTP